MSEDILLSIKGLTKRYPGVVANNNINIDIRRGEVHTLVGENGAGKSTLIKSLSGSVIPDSGEIIWEGESYARMNPKLSSELGISIVYQELILVEPLSIAENISLGVKSSKGIFVDHSQYKKVTEQVFSRMGVKLDPKKLVEELSTAEQQLVEIAKAISKNVKLLVLDEPTAPLTTEEIDSLFEIIASLKKQGVTIIYISHRMDEVFQISDRITVLRDGESIATVNAADIDRAGIIKLMVGRTLNEVFPRRTLKTKEKMLEVKSLYGNGDEDINIHVNKGEIVGLAGILGAGRTELARMIYGADPIVSGEVIIQGKIATITSPVQGIEHSLGFVPEDRKHQGVLTTFGIDWNITLPSIPKLSKYGFLRFKSMTEMAKEFIQQLRIATPAIDAKVEKLSGGNQQKVVVAKTLATGSRIIIFDEPTRGIDVGAKQEIYKLMADLVNDGACILLISSDMEELIGMSDRIYVMADGQIAGELQEQEISQLNIMTLISDSMDSNVVAAV